MKEIITIQHCQSQQHVNGMMGGWNDWELTELGQAQRLGERLGKELRGKSVKIYSSDLKRAAQTAAPLANVLGLDVAYRQELRERNGGPLMEGKSKAWYRERRENAGYLADQRPLPGMETKRELYQRLYKIYEEAIEATEDIVVLVSHGGALGVWNILWLGLPPEAMNSCGIQGKAGSVGRFSRFEESGMRRITCVGDLSYIQD